MDDRITRKLGPEAFRRLQTGEGGSEVADERLRILLRTEKKPEQDDINAMKDAGFALETQAGDVMTGSIETKALERLAGLGCIRYIELSHTMFAEDEHGYDVE